MGPSCVWAGPTVSCPGSSPGRGHKEGTGGVAGGVVGEQEGMEAEHSC